MVHLAHIPEKSDSYAVCQFQMVHFGANREKYGNVSAYSNCRNVDERRLSLNLTIHLFMLC